jgi:threonine/homoserine/homoserine lactone efflux protein
MDLEKRLCLGSVIASGLVILIFLLDLIVGFPFQKVSIMIDIMFLLGAGLVLWQGIESYREFR